MSGLKTYQFEIELNKIYSLEKFSDDYRYATPSIFVVGSGSVDIYSDEETPAIKADMQLEHEDISNHKSFLTIPNYIYLEQNTATVTKVILTGIKPTLVT